MILIRFVRRISCLASFQICIATIRWLQRISSRQEAIVPRPSRVSAIMPWWLPISAISSMRFMNTRKQRSTTRFPLRSWNRCRMIRSVPRIFHPVMSWRLHWPLRMARISARRKRNASRQNHFAESQAGMRSATLMC